MPKKAIVRVPKSGPLMEIVQALHEPLRDFAAVSAWSGLRLSEVAALRQEDVALFQRDGETWAKVHVRNGKGGKERWSIVFPQGAVGLWDRAYRDDYVFLNDRYNRWTPQSVWHWWDKARSEVGFEDYRFHDLRRLHGSYLLNVRHLRIEDVAIQMGHFDKYGNPNTKMTNRYYANWDHGAALDRIVAGVSTGGDLTDDLTETEWNAYLAAAPRYGGEPGLTGAEEGRGGIRIAGYPRYAVDPLRSSDDVARTMVDLGMLPPQPET